MGNEATSCLAAEQTVQPGSYETLETIQDVVAKVQYLTTAHDAQFALVTITLYFELEEKTATNRISAIDAIASTHSLLRGLRRLVRRTDIVVLQQQTLYFFLLGANLQGGQIVESRLWDALLWNIHNATEGELFQPQGIAIGHSAYPAPCDSMAQLIEAAQEIKQHATILPDRWQRKASSRSSRGSSTNDTAEELPALARKMGVPYLSLLPRKPSERVQQLVNPRLAQELHCYPVGRERNTLTVAMLNPQDSLVLARLQQETGLQIFPVLAHPQELQLALEQLI